MEFYLRLALILIILAIPAGFVFVIVWREQRITGILAPIWQELAQQLDLRRAGWPQRGQIGQYRQRPMALSRRKSRWNITVGVRNPRGAQMLLNANTTTMSLVKAEAWGDASLDEWLVVQYAKPARLLPHLLAVQPALRAALLQMREYSFQLFVRTQELSFTINSLTDPAKIPATPEAWLRIINTLCDIAEAMEQSELVDSTAPFEPSGQSQTAFSPIIYVIIAIVVLQTLGMVIFLMLRK